MFAKQMVMDLVAQKEIIIPRPAVGVVIGKNGDMIKRIQQDSGARVQFIQGKEDILGNKFCQVTGTMDQVQKASSLIGDLIQSVMVRDQQIGVVSEGNMVMAIPGHGRGRSGMGIRPDLGPAALRMGRPAGNEGATEVQFAVPANKCGLVIGKRGETVHNINQQAGAHVEIARGAPPNPHEKIFIIRGNPQQIEHAKQLIMERVGGMLPGQGGPPGGHNMPGGPQGQYPGPPQHQQQYQVQPGPGQPYAPAGWAGDAYQPSPNQPAPTGVPVTQRDPAKVAADAIAAAWAAYYAQSYNQPGQAQPWAVQMTSAQPASQPAATTAQNKFSAVQVDEGGEKVRPNPQSGGLILREIPESTPLQVASDIGVSPQAANSNRHNYSSREREKSRLKENSPSEINKVLSSLYEAVAGHISKAKLGAITDCALKNIKKYKHTVKAVEEFIKNSPPEYKVPGLYVVHSIVKKSQKLFGSEKDVFGPRFIKNIFTTFQHLFKCSEENRSKIIRILHLWQKKNVFPIDVLQLLLDMAHSHELQPHHKSPDSWKGWPQNTKESVQENAEIVAAEGSCLSGSRPISLNATALDHRDLKIPAQKQNLSAVLQPDIVAREISSASSSTSIAVSAPLQRFKQDVGAFLPALYKSETSTKSGAPSQPRYSTSQPSTPLMMSHSTAYTNLLIKPDGVGYSLPVTSVAACPMSAQATTSQTKVEKHKEMKEKESISSIKCKTKQESKSRPPSDYSCGNPSFVDRTASQSLSAVHVSTREEECNKRRKLRQDLENSSPLPIFGTPVKVPEEEMSRRLKKCLGNPTFDDLNDSHDKPQDKQNNAVKINYSQVWVEYYRSLGMFREAEMIEQQSRGNQVRGKNLPPSSTADSSTASVLFM